MSDSILEELNKAKSDLAKAEEFQELMKKGNAIIRKGKDVVASLVAELKMTEATAQKLIQKDFAGRTGFPTYKLTNNNANIKRLRDRVKMLEDKWGGARDQHATGETEQYEFTAGPGGTIEVNYSVDRVQILFAGKPDADIRTPLKQNGWRWSPTEGAWQRKITPQAISNAVHLLKATKAAAATEALEVASEEITEPNAPEDFDQAIFDQLDPHAGWVGHQVKERVVKNQIYKLLTGPEAEKATETERLFEKYKAKHPSDSNESDDLVNPPEEKPLPATDYSFFTRLAQPEFAEVREKLEAFDPFSLTDWEYYQYEDLSKKHGKAGALQLIMNNAERDWKHVSKKLAAIGRLQDKIEAKEAKAASRASATKASGTAKPETVEQGNNGTEKPPSYRAAKPKERDIIIETFGEENLPAIESILGDVIDLYPYKQYYRVSASGEVLQTIGASGSAENYFYLLGANGNVYLEHSFSLFPAQITNEMVTKKYPNQYELNKAIERMIEEKGDDAQNYSSDEKAWIRKYSGYGGLEKFGTAGKGAFFEYYTPTDVIAKMWALAYKYGYNNGPVLEPSVATGEFLQFAKPGIRIVGFEISNYSAAICKVLYPAADIRLMPFEQNFIKNNFTIKDKLEGLEKFDLVIGNPPYGDFSVVESRYMSGMGEKSHVRPENYVEYFLRRGVDLLNPGGLLIYIIGAAIAGGGKMFLDQGNTAVKEYLAQTTELLDAYRLPDTVFERTGVTSDIIVLKKK